jgi:hypothetical protein
LAAVLPGEEPGRCGLLLSSDKRLRGPGYVTRDTCRTGDLAQVEVRRNVGQTLVTLLTLGIVSPATIYYLCEKPQPPPPCNCSQDNNQL